MDTGWQILMQFTEDGLISFKVSRLPKVSEILTRTKPNFDSVTVTPSISCLLKGLQLERRGKMEVPGCIEEQKALSSATYYIKLVLWGKTGLTIFRSCFHPPSYVRSQTNINRMDFQCKPNI